MNKDLEKEYIKEIDRLNRRILGLEGRIKELEEEKQLQN